MQVQVNDAGSLTKQLTISYTADEVAARRNQLIREFGNRAKVDGFRPGKTSRALLEKRFGPAATAQSLDDLADEGLQKAIAEQQLKPLGAITPVSRDAASGLSVTVSFEVHPPVTLPAAGSIDGLDLSPAEVGDAQVDEMVTSMARRAGTMSVLTADETVIADDSVTLVGGVSVDGAEVRALHDFHHLVGGYPLFGKPADDVVAAFAGKKVGDQIAFTATLPASFTPAEFAGKEGALSVTIQAAERLRATVVDDAFAQKVGATDLADLRARLKQRLQSTKSNEQRSKQVEALVAKLVETVPVELPAKIRAGVAENAAAQAAAGKTGDEAEAAKIKAVADAEADLKKFIIFEALASSQEVQVTREDLEDQIRMAAYQTGRKPDAIAKQLQTSGKVPQVVQEIRHAKAVETFLDAVIAAKQPAAAAQG